jgi:hypothetical protein
MLLSSAVAKVTVGFGRPLVARALGSALFAIARHLALVCGGRTDDAVGLPPRLRVNGARPEVRGDETTLAAGQRLSRDRDRAPVRYLRRSSSRNIVLPVTSVTSASSA